MRRNTISHAFCAVSLACLALAATAAQAGGYGGSLYGSAYGGVSGYGGGYGGSGYSMSTGAYAPSYGHGYGQSNYGASNFGTTGNALPYSGGFPRVGPVYNYSNNFGAQSAPSYPTYNRGTNYATPPQYPTQINSTMHMRRWSLRRGN